MNVRPPSPRLLASILALATGAALVVAVKVPGTVGGYSARLSNAANAVTTNSFWTCAQASTTLGASVAWPLDDTGVLNVAGMARDISGANRTGLYTVGGVSYRRVSTACPRDTVSGTAYNIVLNGSTGFVSRTTALPLDSSFTESVWFNTTTTRGGRLIGFGNAATGASTEYDRQVWMNNSGQLYFGVYPNAVKTVNSTASYNDGAWHQVVVTLGTNGMTLYVDGAQVAQDPTVTTAQTYSTNAMYLRVGYDNLDNWVSIPTSYYFAGSVRFAAYFTTTLIAAQVGGLYAAGLGS
ncbi:LamG domain-containing protein [Jatrophihabitans sp. YIM 134969]